MAYTGKDLIPVKDVAKKKLLPISYDKLLNMIRNDEIEHVELVGKYYLTREIIADYITQSVSKAKK